MDCCNSIFMHNIPPHIFRHTHTHTAHHQTVANMVFLRDTKTKKVSLSTTDPPYLNSKNRENPTNYRSLCWHQR